MNKSIWLIAALLLTEVLVITFLVSPDWVRSTSTREGRAIVASLGVETASEIQQQADAWYVALIVEPGVKQVLFEALIPSEYQRLNSRGLEDLGSDLWPVVADRINTFTLVVYWLMCRFSQFMMWLPACLPALIAAILAGRYRRMIKQATFEKASGIILQYSWKTAIFSLGIFFLAFLLPLSIPPWIFPIIIFGTLMTLGLSVGNIIKRI